MSLKKQYSKSTAHINELNIEDKSKAGLITRNCIAVPNVKIRDKKPIKKLVPKCVSFVETYLDLFKACQNVAKPYFKIIKSALNKASMFVVRNVRKFYSLYVIRLLDKLSDKVRISCFRSLLDKLSVSKMISRKSVFFSIKTRMKSYVESIRAFAKNLKPYINNMKEHIIKTEELYKIKKYLSLIVKTYYALILKHRRRVMVVASSFVLVFFIGVAIAYQTRQSGYEVFMGETQIGVIHSIDEFEQYYKRVQNDLSSIVANGIIFDKQPRYVEKKFWSSQFSSQKAIEKNIKSIVNITIPGYAIIVEGKQMGILKDLKSAEDVLNRLKQQYTPENSNVKVEFDKDVKIETLEVKLKDISDSEGVFATLSGLEDSIKKYSVKKDDTLWDIAIDHRMPVEEILRLNPKISENLQPGDEINLSIPNPVLGIRTREKIEYTEGIPFDIAEVQDSELYVGRRTIVERGENGEKKVQAEIIKVNGIETGKEIVNEVVLAQPKVQTEKVGTKPTPPKFATGKFGRPVYGVLTSRYGYRWGRMHSGIDLSASIGTPVNASDGGKVISAGWEGAYGYLVKIAHDNEYTTYYGHLNKISVKSGQRVAKGEQIGTVGNTGRSTGPHLHFEVRKNGSPVNPLNYLNR